MKLFDRSVDFAQFSEDTPLYALARAWMQNKPYGTKLSDSQDGNLDGDSPSNSQESTFSSSSQSVSRKYYQYWHYKSCFLEDVSTRQWPYFSFRELRCSLLEFNSRKIWQIEWVEINVTNFEAVWIHLAIAMACTSETLFGIMISRL